MAWFTTDDGRHVNTDWLDPEDQLKYKQIQANKMIAQQLSEITHPIISKPEGSGKVFTSYNNNASIKGNKNVNSAPEQEYERTSKMDWIEKRIEGKKKELEKAEKKLERVKAAQASNWTKNPYWYNERDLTSTQKDIDRIKTDMEKYAADMQTEIDKAKSRNVPAITNFLNDWKEKSINFYLKEHDKYNEAYKEYQDQVKEYREWQHSDAGYNASREEEHKRYIEFEKRRKQFKNDWMHVTQFQAGSGTWEENMRKAVEDERVRKYNDIIERTTAITGRITDANGLKVGGKGDLNGIIEGEKGSVRLETIGAGGYNIQRFHFRTLIHEVDPEVYKKWRAEQDKKAAPKPAPKPLNTVQSTQNKPAEGKTEQEKQSDYLINTVRRLKNKGMSSKEDVEKYVNELSDLRRYDLAKKLGVQAKGQERRQQLVDKIHKAFNESNATQESVKKTEKPKKKYEDYDKKVNDTLIVQGPDGKYHIEKWKGQDLDNYPHQYELNHDKLADMKWNSESNKFDKEIFKDISFDDVYGYLEKEFNFDKGGKKIVTNKGFNFQEGNKQEIRKAAIEDLTKKANNYWKDSKIAKYFAEEDVKAVDAALNYFEENNIKNIVDKSDYYADSIKWKFSGKDRSTGKFASFEFDSLPKESNAIDNLKGNGYSVTDKILLPVKLHNYLIEHTNMTESDIKAVRSIAKVVIANYKKAGK